MVTVIVTMDSEGTVLRTNYTSRTVKAITKVLTYTMWECTKDKEFGVDVVIDGNVTITTREKTITITEEEI